MRITEHLSTFAGLPVAEFDAAVTSGDGLPSTGDVAWRVRTEAWEETAPPFDLVFQRFVEKVDTSRVTALVIGYWGSEHDNNESEEEPVDLLTEAAERFPNLRALFLGDIVTEENEISWIEQSDITPLFETFPLLAQVEVRGGDFLSLQPIRSDALKVLRFESGGLPAGVVRAVGAGDLPNLEHLDLWLGAGEYGGDATVADLAPILSGERLPALRHLGLEDSEIQDEIAAAVAGAPVAARLESLSLAMGALSDEGAEALLSGQPLTHLKKLDLHHHFLSDAMVTRISAALPGVAVDLSGQKKGTNDWRYVAVSE